ncbi:hypothetical protein QUF81_16055 [Peribacillus simplex]|uniref:Uncharacterized protein n=1 Tax=Peribacillus simplex TaxID=1478 RepID=A0AAW7IBX0_9BACI|nr:MULTISPECIES: hypothetical protein [Peribacillus]MDM5294673.1 hypothetical protein [Peribacillus simplex]MDM5453625.1 hypothetical protein [Peribacillus simplex]MDV7764598.1 hypothetical protein [Peribacillus sp. CSMR9]
MYKANETVDIERPISRMSYDPVRNENKRKTSWDLDYSRSFARSHSAYFVEKK